MPSQTKVRSLKQYINPLQATPVTMVPIVIHLHCVFSTKNIVVAMGSVMRMVSDFLTKQGVSSFRIIHWKSGNQIYQVRNLQCCVY